MGILNKKTIKEIFSNKNNDFQILKPIEFSKNFENELIFFFKPDCFTNKSADDFQKISEMVFEKFSKFDVEISGAILYSGDALKRYKIMSQHYGFINKLSTQASSILSNEEKETMKNQFDLSEIDFYGGHEFMKKFPKFSADSTNELWLTKHSCKIQSGFYYQLYDVNGKQIIMINGFHPAQLEHYTTSDKKIVLCLLHSNTSWAKIKNDLTGRTYPENSLPDSIRGALYSNKDVYNSHNISVSKNYVHMSAGPFEALFELNNFFSPIEELNFDITQTNLGIKLNSSGYDALKTLKNPTVNVNGVSDDLFSATENMDSKDSLDFLL